MTMLVATLHSQVRSVEILVRDAQGRTLLQMRDGQAETYPLTWSFWGGAVDASDLSLMHAAARELHEELSVLAAPDEFELVAKRIAPSGRVAPLVWLRRPLCWQYIEVREGAGAAWFCARELAALNATPSVFYHLQQNSSLFI